MALSRYVHYMSEFSALLTLRFSAVDIKANFSFLSPQSTKAVYDRIIDLRIATPQIIINFAMFLEEHNYFEESFKVRTLLVLFRSKMCTCPD